MNSVAIEQHLQVHGVHLPCKKFIVSQCIANFLPMVMKEAKWGHIWLINRQIRNKGTTLTRQKGSAATAGPANTPSPLLRPASSLFQKGMRIKLSATRAPHGSLPACLHPRDRPSPALAFRLNTLREEPTHWVNLP